VHPATDPGAAADTAARQARQRAFSARVRRDELDAEPTERTRNESSGHVEEAVAALDLARERATTADARRRTGQLRSGSAHERAAAQHDLAARRGGTGAPDHRQRAAAHLAAAAADRLLAAGENS
jgi:hypothetical protein